MQIDECVVWWSVYIHLNIFCIIAILQKINYSGCSFLFWILQRTGQCLLSMAYLYLYLYLAPTNNFLEMNFPWGSLLQAVLLANKIPYLGNAFNVSNCNRKDTQKRVCKRQKSNYRMINIRLNIRFLQAKKYILYEKG